MAVTSSVADTQTPPLYLRPLLSEGLAPRPAMLDWFRSARFGLFIHYGLYSLLGRHEWVQWRERIRVADYARLADQFTAEAFDADTIAELAVDAGMRYVNLTTRHDDSFCLWDTATTEFNSVQAPRCGRDLVGELAEACQARGLGLCLYLSHGRDWRHPHAPNNDRFGGRARPPYDPPEPTYATGSDHDLREYVAYIQEQVTELLTNYGAVTAIWLDGIAVPLTPLNDRGEPLANFRPTPASDPFRCQALYDHIHALQPWTLVSYKQGYLHTEDFYAPEHDAIDAGGKPCEICTTMTPGSWGFHRDLAGKHLSAEDVWARLEEAGRRNCNLLLNTAPLPDGALNPAESQVLRAVGQRIRRRGLPRRDPARRQEATAGRS